MAKAHPGLGVSGECKRVMWAVAVVLPLVSAACTGDLDESVFHGRHALRDGAWELSGRGANHFVRVQDMLVLIARKKLQPRQIRVRDVCHKDMADPSAPDPGYPAPKPHPAVSDTEWAALWRECGRKLANNRRMARACPDVPGIVVLNPTHGTQEPGDGRRKSNNPCQRQFRMVDGAHRMCSRKRDLLVSCARRRARRGKLNAAAVGAVGDIQTHLGADGADLQNVCAPETRATLPYFVLAQGDVEPLIYEHGPEQHVKWPTLQPLDALRVGWHMSLVAQVQMHEIEHGSNATQRFLEDLADLYRVHQRARLPTARAHGREWATGGRAKQEEMLQALNEKFGSGAADASAAGATNPDADMDAKEALDPEARQAFRKLARHGGGHGVDGVSSHGPLFTIPLSALPRPAFPDLWAMLVRRVQPMMDHIQGGGGTEPALVEARALVQQPLNRRLFAECGAAIGGSSASGVPEQSEGENEAGRPDVDADGRYQVLERDAKRAYDSSNKVVSAYGTTAEARQARHQYELSELDNLYARWAQNAGNDTESTPALRTSDGRWTWYRGAYFSSRHTERSDFRRQCNSVLAKHFGLDEDYGTYLERHDSTGEVAQVDERRRVYSSGLYWYPPGAVREWHTNRHDVHDGASWRAYLTMVIPDGNSQRSSSSPVPRLGSSFCFWDAERQVAVTVPSVNATLTLFRLGELDHDAFWHCIKSHDVHRFSMGFALDEISARLLVRDAARNLALV